VNEESCTMRTLIFCTTPQILLGRSNQEEQGGQDMWHAWERNVYRVDGKARRKETNWKTKAEMGEWDQNGSQGDWLGECTLDPAGSG
jgi:hypothetical protein